MNGVEPTVARLWADAASGELGDLCGALGIDLLVLFGSAREDASSARDVDLGYSRRGAAAGDHLQVVNALGERYGDALDLMQLDRAGVVARFEALARGTVLVERTPGKFARTQMAAMGEYYDDQPLRDLALRTMAR